MGKCVSKQPIHLGSASYLAICDEDDILYINVGQSESKKNKKAGGVETKGTAMSFGFKKKSHNAAISNTNSRKSPHTTGLLDKDKEKDAMVISNPGILKTVTSDNNGNNTTGAESFEETSTKSSGRLTPRLQPPKKELHGTSTFRSNRFGFRQTNIVRPASAGITPKIAEFDTKQTNANAINNNIYVTDKRRSKSASATARNSTAATSAVKIQRDPKIDVTNTGQINQLNANVGGKQYTAIDSGLHTNPIIKPTPKTYSQQPAHLSYQHQAPQPLQRTKETEPLIPAPVTVSKFTLHTTSLPKPQYPVPISLATNLNAPTVQPSQNLMDIKGAKQAVNISRKELGAREESTDSGIASHDHDDQSEMSLSMLARHRYRHLEMVMNGPHRFQVRDLDALTTEPLISLPFPKIPVFNGANQAAPLSGLVRNRNNDNIGPDDNRYALMEKQDSVGSSDDAESFEEEKLMRDNNSSEKSLKGAIAKDLSSSQYSKNSSPGSSRASWCNAGEAMAIKDCSSLSLSSYSDESNNAKVMQCELIIREEDDLTMSIDPPSMLFSSMMTTSTITAETAESTSSLTEPQRLFSDVQSNFNDDTEIMPSNNYKRNEDRKFAEMAAAISDGLLLDDETSPTDSLNSMSESDETKKNKKKAERKEREKDIDENCTELDMDILSPVSPGTPTHASNSLSLSDGGRDFLIDDEIADQPALVFDDNVNDNSIIDIHSIHLNLGSQHTDSTPTLKDSVSSQKTPIVKPRKIMAELYESPLLPRKSRNRRLSKAESLDTLSPCDSITSDDFMLDFDMSGSVDSIDRHPRSNGSGSHSAMHSLDEQALLSELEHKSGEIMREWSTLLRSRTYSNHTTSRESITSQLPARATRLLTRRLQNTTSTPNGSDSPRSYDSLPRRALSSSIKTSTLNHDYSDSNLLAANSAEDLTLLDKSLRNSMLQDVVHFKKQLVRLRRILQEDEENLMMSDTLNPFDNNNGPFFTPSSDIENKQHENTLIKESGVVALLEDQRQELNDLRRQVVYLQSQIDDKDRTIRMQQNLIEKYEAERKQLELNGDQIPNQNDKINVETISIATQTERLRPLSIGQDGLARNEHQITTNCQPPQPQPRNGLKLSNGLSSSPTTATTQNGSSPSSPSNRSSNLKPKTQISSIYTQLSSIKHSNPTNGTLGHKKSASLTLPNGSAKTVRTTLIGNSNTVNFSKINQNGSPVSPIKPVRNSLRPSSLNLNGNSTTIKNSMNGRKVSRTPPSSPIIVMENGNYNKHPLQNHFLNGNTGMDEKLVDDLNNQINLTKIN